MLMEGIDRSIANPPIYLLPGNWASDSGAMNCTGWSIAMWRYAGLPESFGVSAWVFSPYGQAAALVISNVTNTAYLSARTWVRRDPLVLDLDGDGIETVGINPDNPILFDHDGDGTKNATGWIKADDGLVVGGGLLRGANDLRYMRFA